MDVGHKDVRSLSQTWIKTNPGYDPCEIILPYRRLTSWRKKHSTFQTYGRPNLKKKLRRQKACLSDFSVDESLYIPILWPESQVLSKLRYSLGPSIPWLYQWRSTDCQIKFLPPFWLTGTAILLTWAVRPPHLIASQILGGLVAGMHINKVVLVQTSILNAVPMVWHINRK